MIDKFKKILILVICVSLMSGCASSAETSTDTTAGEQSVEDTTTESQTNEESTKDQTTTGGATEGSTTDGATEDSTTDGTTVEPTTQAPTTQTPTTETPTEESTTVKPEDKYTYTDMTLVLYSKISLNVRKTPSTDGAVIGYLAEGQAVNVTGQCNETGWYRVDLDGQVGYASNIYLATEEEMNTAEVYAEAALLMDMDTGEILYEKNINKKLYPASVTKIMTALLTLENCKLDEMVTYKEEVKQIPSDSSIYGVKVGEQVSVKDSLYMLMLVSGNDVAVGLGMHVAGTEAEFAKMMTKRAKEIGAVNTNFVNAHGYDDPNHYTTASDMALITMEALKNPDFRDVWGTAEYDVPATNMVSSVTHIAHTNKMIRENMPEYYEYALGGKTGFTTPAGRCLITTASKDGKNLLCVILKSNRYNQYKDAEKLYEYGFGLK